MKFADTTSTDVKCPLNGGKPKVSSPSLKQCYIFTRDSCCTSSHDSDIADKLKGLVSESCIDEFDNLIQYYCFGCNSQSPKFAITSKDGKTKTLKICKSFAERLWAGGEYNFKSLSDGKPRSTYDNCGLKIGESGKEEIKIQSRDYKTYEDFFKDIKPPFFEDYDVEFVDGTTDCYNIAHKLGGFVVVLALSIMSML